MIRFVIAPRFHLDGDWPARLRIGSAEALRAPGAEELALLMGTDRDDPIALFRIPDHLRSTFWKLLQDAPDLGAGGFPGFDRFVKEFGEFLAFKSFDLPAAARCDLVVSQVPRREAELWGAINLADEPTSVVFLSATAAVTPTVQLVLGPGEGFRLSGGSAIVTQFPAAKTEPDVLLLIGRGAK